MNVSSSYADSRRVYSSIVLALAGVLLTFQVYWFSRFLLWRVDIDGISYVGIARHLLDGNAYASINAFRSPLISWLMAMAARVGNPDLLLVGKVISVASFVVALILSFQLTERLWNSRLAASCVVLWLVLARGLVPASIGLVTPDFLFAAIILLYHLLLLRCFQERERSLSTWFSLGAVMGLAFLCKAFALPWLLLTTCFAGLLLFCKLRALHLSRLVAALGVPILMAASWAAVLHSKYGVFTTGTQFKTNFYQGVLGKRLDNRDRGYVVLHDMSGLNDEYMVTDPLPPQSSLLKEHLQARTLVIPALAAERHNLPVALKELVIVLTPGGILAFALICWQLRRPQEDSWPQYAVAASVLFGTVTLLVAYCMLVFDGRYLFPLYPLLMAVSIAGIIPVSTLRSIGRWQRVVLASLVVGGLIFGVSYRSSPWRLTTRDFQPSCRDAATELVRHGVKSVVTIGSGPYPEHGVGWEAGFVASFLSGSRVIAQIGSLPEPSSSAGLLADIRNANPDALLIWGSPREQRYAQVERLCLTSFLDARMEPIHDPERGQVGSILYLKVHT